MNVLDHLKGETVDDIKTYCKNSAIQAGVAMMHVSGDYNLSTLIRNANFFGYSEVCYVGIRNWDRRGSVGTHHYTDLQHYKTENDFLHYIRSNNYRLIAVENNIPQYSHKTLNLFAQTDYDVFGDKPMFVFGEEKVGLSDNMLQNSDCIVTIPAYGSVRSLNVGTTSGIVMAMYRKLYNENCD